uniref:Uncharacterized protein n=1 Tax=Anguilla anguilla TaxID=7936 RepID=A0A0E9W5N3_ANGAN
MLAVLTTCKTTIIRIVIIRQNKRDRPTEGQGENYIPIPKKEREKFYITFMNSYKRCND